MGRELWFESASYQQLLTRYLLLLSLCWPPVAITSLSKGNAMAIKAQLIPYSMDFQTKYWLSDKIKLKGTFISLYISYLPACPLHMIDIDRQLIPVFGRIKLHKELWRLILQYFVSNRHFLCPLLLQNWTLNRDNFLKQKNIFLDPFFIQFMRPKLWITIFQEREKIYINHVYMPLPNHLNLILSCLLVLLDRRGANQRADYLIL